MLICDILVNGTPPSAIIANIQTISAALTVSELNELPPLYYVRKCRVAVHSLNYMLADFILGKA